MKKRLLRVQMSRRSDRVVFALKPETRIALRREYPEAIPTFDTSSISPEKWRHEVHGAGDAIRLARGVLPTITGLEWPQLAEWELVLTDHSSGKVVGSTAIAALA